MLVQFQNLWFSNSLLARSFAPALPFYCFHIWQPLQCMAPLNEKVQLQERTFLFSSWQQAWSRHDQQKSTAKRCGSISCYCLFSKCKASSHSSLKLVCSLWFWHWLDCQMLTQIARHWCLQNGLVLHSKWSVAFWCVCTHCVKRKFGCKLVWHPCCLWIYLDCNTVIYFCCTVEVCDFNFLIDLPR